MLIGLAPPFKKLKNPLLRKRVAKVASLKHAAAGIEVHDLVNKLGSEDAGSTASYFSAEPDWFSTLNIVKSIDERTASQDKMPIAVVLQEASHLQAGDILELVTAFPRPSKPFGKALASSLTSTALFSDIAAIPFSPTANDVFRVTA
jgi:hypothetical protein